MPVESNSPGPQQSGSPIAPISIGVVVTLKGGSLSPGSSHCLGCAASAYNRPKLGLFNGRRLYTFAERGVWESAHHPVEILPCRLLLHSPRT